MYCEAWLYIFVLFLPTLIFTLYLFAKNPELIERRMRTKEKEKVHNRVVMISALFIVAVFITSCFDRRFGGSAIPVYVIIILVIEIMCCYLFFFRVLMKDRFASRTVGIEKEHKLITTALYKIIRHPIYLARLFIFTNTSFVVDSYWASIGNIFIIFLLIVLIKDKEKMLIEQLEGYKEYMQRVKYRLIPGFWKFFFFMDKFNLKASHQNIR